MTFLDNIPNLVELPLSEQQSQISNGEGFSPLSMPFANLGNMPERVITGSNL